MDIVTIAAARKGSGGGASKEYVDEKVAALIDDTTAAQNKAYSSAKVEEKVAGEEITTTATGSDLTLSTSFGSLNALTVYGKSEVVDDAITSAGEGWATVDLGTLNWLYREAKTCFSAPLPYEYTKSGTVSQILCTKYAKGTQKNYSNWQNANNNEIFLSSSENNVVIKDTDYTTVSDFIASLGDTTLCYQLADPTQGNTIAVKTDDGTGIDGTMASFSTGTPLRGIPDTDVRDVMTWDGSSGEVTKNCGVPVDLSSLEWKRRTTGINPMFYASVPNSKIDSNGLISETAYTKYPNTYASRFSEAYPDKAWCMSSATTQIYFRDDSILTESDFTTAMSGVKLVYELATPTTEHLISTENASIAGLRTFEPQTHAQNNAGAEMTVEAYAGTANGKAVQELKQDVQSEITALKITQSDTLTLTVADWSSNTQTVTYAHDTAKRNVIDVDPASVEEWANCGVLATSETASGITFTCKTVPENALTFRVTSMGVN